MDFFVSYTQTDRLWAEWIAWQVEEEGYRVSVQAWDFVPGSNWVQGMQNGILSATRTIAVLSGDYLKSVYGGAEWQAAWAADPGGQDRKLLIVRVTDCDRPGLMGGVVGIDIFGIGEASARSRVRLMLTQAICGRAKPDSEPPYPGTPTSPHEHTRRQARFPDRRRSAL